MHLDQGRCTCCRECVSKLRSLLLLQAEAPAELQWHELETVLPLPGSPSWLGINAGGSLALVTGTCTIEVRHACTCPFNMVAASDAGCSMLAGLNAVPCCLRPRAPQPRGIKAAQQLPAA